MLAFLYVLFGQRASCEALAVVVAGLFKVSSTAPGPALWQQKIMIARKQNYLREDREESGSSSQEIRVKDSFSLMIVTTISKRAINTIMPVL